jgi:hypothetical protein
MVQILHASSSKVLLICKSTLEWLVLERYPVTVCCIFMIMTKVQVWDISPQLDANVSVPSFSCCNWVCHEFIIVKCSDYGTDSMPCKFAGVIVRKYKEWSEIVGEIRNGHANLIFLTSGRQHISLSHNSRSQLIYLGKSSRKWVLPVALAVVYVETSGDRRCLPQFR